MKKKILFTLIAGLILTGAVYGSAAALNVTGVDKLGSQMVTVNSPTAVTGVSWAVSPDGTDVTGVTISFGTSVTGNLYVTLYDGNGNAIGWTTSPPTAINGTSVVVAIDNAITNPAAVANILITITE